MEKPSMFAARSNDNYANPAWRKWLLFGALALALGLAFVITNGSLGMGMQGSNLAGVAGAGADTPTPTELAAPTEIPAATPTALPTATSAPTLDVGDSWVRPSDGMVMMYVPAGAFSMGVASDQALTECIGTRGECKETWFTDETPHQVELSAYWMDQTEVTNAMYALCVNAGVCKLPQQTESYNVVDYYDNPQYANYPVTFVDWYQANDYCMWAGARLPTEAEWEKAARGTDGRYFPWGNSAPSCSLANIHPFNGDACKNDTSVVTEYPVAQSPYQILNMAGNVFEWVADWYGRDYYANSPLSNPQGPADGQYKVLRGGAWYFDAEFARSTYRYKHDPLYYYSFTGFRCARSE